MESQNIEYTIVVNGKPEGPYRLEELKTMSIRSGTFIRTPGMDDYKEAHEFPELRELLGFTFQKTAPQYFASFDQRLLASVIDWFFILLAFAVLLFIVYMFVSDKEIMMYLAVFTALLLGPAKIIYGSIGDASEKQGTIGKNLLNIRVTDLIGDRITFSVSLLRNSSKLVSTAPFCFGYLYSFLNKKQQCFHDLIANTLVIKDRLI